MTVKLFVLGCPGSGKSTIARHIVEHVSQVYQEWTATHFNDYEILHRMFEEDEDNFFWPAEHGGFIVRERSVYNEVLKKLEENVNNFYCINNDFIIIEFARSNYEDAFKLFGPGFLHNAYFLFLDADINTCIRRTRERVCSPKKTKDDYFVSEHVFEYYYHSKNKDYFYSSPFKKQYEVEEARIKIVNNVGSEEDCAKQVHRFVDLIYNRECETSNDVKLPVLALS